MAATVKLRCARRLFVGAYTYVAVLLAEYGT